VFFRDFRVGVRKLRIAGTWQLRVQEGHEPLGGSGGMLPRKVFENYVAGDAIWCILGPTHREKLHIIFAQFLRKFGTM